MIKEKEEEKEEKGREDSRTSLWKKYLDNYRAANPVKYEAKMKAGDFGQIPVSFKGILKTRTVTTPDGKKIVRELIY